MSNVVVNVEALFQKLMSGEVKADSQFKLRSEQAASGNRMAKVGRLKRALDKNSKLIFMVEIAVPFNPATGKEDELYNTENKWRPLVTATTASLLLKMYANQNPEAKAEFERRANVQDWDTSNVTELTDTDRSVLRLYRVPRIFTIPVFDVRDKLIGGDYSKQFMVDIKRDPITNKIVGETPAFLKIAKLWQDLKFEEWTNITECIAAAKEGTYTPAMLKSDNKRIQQIASLSLANITKDETDDVRKEVYGEVPVGRDRAANYVVLYEFPLDGEMNMTDLATFSGNVTSQDMEKRMVYTSLTKEIQTKVFDKFKAGWAKKDIHWDFYEVDMACPAKGTCNDDAMLIGLNTRYENPITSINAAISQPDGKVDEVKSAELFAKIMKLYTEAVNEEQKLEQRFLQSTYVEKYDDIIEGQLIDSLGQAKIFSHKFLTVKVANANKEILVKAYGKKANQFFMELEVGLSDAEEGKLDEDAAARSADQAGLVDLLRSGGAESREDGTLLESGGNKEEVVAGAGAGTGAAPSLTANVAGFTME